MAAGDTRNYNSRHPLRGFPSAGLSARQPAEKPDQNNKKKINRCHVGTPVLEMSLETEAAALPQAPSGRWFGRQPSFITMAISL